MPSTIDFPWVRPWQDVTPRAAVDACSAKDGDKVGWWREHLQEQGYTLEQIEQLVAYYSNAPWHSGPVRHDAG
jgi:hypothetical protein